MSKTVYSKACSVDGQLMLPIPQVAVEFLNITDGAVVEFAIGDALVILSNASTIAEKCCLDRSVDDRPA